MDTLQGTINRIRFQKADTGWTVAELGDGTPIVGILTGVVPGMDVTLHGEWNEHPQYGKQFKVAAHRTARPSTVEALTIYLQEMIYGIGPHLARQITGHFGTQTPHMMDDPERLALVHGIGRKKAQAIAKSWVEHEAERAVLEDLLTFLVQNGLPTSLAHAAFQEWKFEAVNVLQANPYRLIDLRGVGFKRADAIALQLGIARDAPERIQAALEYTLKQSTINGNCYRTRANLERETGELVSLVGDPVSAQVDALAEQERVVIDGEAVYLRWLHTAETEAAFYLNKLLTCKTVLDIDTTTLPGDIAYTHTQQAAIRAAFAHKVSVITGGPGTGKTTITRAIVQLAKAKYITLCSPTGKAAKRLSEATGHPAATIHRTLRVDPEGGFIHNEHYPLEAELIIIDEASMLDISLARHLLKTIPRRAHVVFVGDIDQLPAVGPGNVLRDIIDSGAIPVTRLDTIFRQGADSYIIPNAHAINRGDMPAYNHGMGGDFYLDTAQDAAGAAQKIVDLVTQRIPKAFGYKADNIQVLTPMHRGEAGDNALNKALQARLNPPSPHKTEIQSGFNTFRVGDTVIQCRNNYDHGIFNGDQGRVTRIGENDEGKQAVWVDFEGELKELKPSDLSDMRLAYAITVHKSQGSEFPVVVMPVLTQHYVMLQRNLLYTGVTRARKLVVLVGNHKAIGIAIKNDRIARRNTRLAERLKKSTS